MDPTKFLTAAAPPVDIDNTVFVQAALFVLLYLLLRPLLFSPWLKVLERRKVSIDGALEAAQKLRLEADAFEQDCIARLERAKEGAMELRSDMRSQTEASQSELLARARSEASRSLESARTKAQRESVEARRQLQSNVEQIAADVFQKVLGRSAS